MQEPSPRWNIAMMYLEKMKIDARDGRRRQQRDARAFHFSHDLPVDRIAHALGLELGIVKRMVFATMDADCAQHIHTGCLGVTSDQHGNDASCECECHAT